MPGAAVGANVVPEDALLTAAVTTGTEEEDAKEPGIGLAEVAD